MAKKWRDEEGLCIYCGSKEVRCWVSVELNKVIYTCESCAQKWDDVLEDE